MFITILITVFLVTTTIVQAQILNNYKTQIKQNTYPKITVSFSEDDFVFETFDGFDVVYLSDGGVLNEVGKPFLPVKVLMVALPGNMKATGIRVLEVTEEVLPSVFDILPAQEPKRIGFSCEDPGFFKDDDFYCSNEYYPSKLVELTGLTDLAGQVIAIVSVYPFQYNPSLKTLKLLTNINFEIIGETGYVCGDYLPDCVSESEIKNYHEKVEAMVVNSEDVVLRKNQGLQPCGVDPGDYDYVVITKSVWVSAFQPLVDWKTKKGVPANIISTEWIYSNYSGSSNKEKIRAFIVDANVNWGSMFFLLGGDSDTIPYHTVSYKGDVIPTDTYYSDYDDDWICEVNVGRASVTGVGSGVGGIGNFVNKVLIYEKNPPITNYCKNVALFGFDLNFITDGEDCKIDIDSLYIPSDWAVTTVYDSESGNHEDAVDLAVNSGQNLINHIDHSNYNVMGVGYVNHDWVLDTSEVDAFSNVNKQSIWYSIGCWAEAFDYDNCIAEHFVRDSDGGGVGFVGNTRSGWFQSGFDDYASLRYDRYFFRSLFVQNHYKLGDLFSDHKMDAYNSMEQDDYNKYIFSELTLLGDPELPVWMDNPVGFVVVHPVEIPVGSSSFSVHVETSTGSNIQDAYVCVWKSDEVYLAGYTNSVGNVSFNVLTNSSGVMSVTVTKQDYLPYEGNISVSLVNNPPNTPSDPDPVNGSIGVDINADLGWNCSDPDGDSLTYDVYFGTSSNPPLVQSNQSATIYDPGTMNFNTNYFWKIIAFDNHSASNASPVWSFTTEINDPPYIPNNPFPIDGATNVDINADISWSGGDPNGDTVYYDIYFGTISPPPLIFQNYSYTTYDPGTMQYNTNYYWKIKAIDVHGAVTMGPEWNFQTKDKPSNYPPEFSNENPSNAATNVTITTTSLSVFISDKEGNSFTWTIETSPNIGNNSGENENNGTKICDILNLECNTKYYWFVNATDIGSGETTSEIYMFTTESASNNPPNKPQINGPTIANSGVSYAFTFTSTDPDQDDVSYYIDWGDDTITDWTDFQSSGETYSENHIWNLIGFYTIKAKAKDTEGAESNWATVDIIIPRNRIVNILFLKLLNNYPYLTKLLQTMVQGLGLFIK